MSKNPKIIQLTDEIILQYTNDNVLTEYRDINLKVDSMPDPYPKGVYDPKYFGSIFMDSCNCGNMRSPGIRCPRCGTTMLSEEDSYKRFGRIESPVYFSNRFKVYNFIKLIKSNFKVTTNFTTKYFEGKKWDDPMVLDNCQFEYDKETEGITVTDNITDFMKCSYEGILQIIQLYKPNILEEAKSHLNLYVLVSPMVMRAPTLRTVDGEKKLENSPISVVYKNIIYCIHEYYYKVFPTVKGEFNKALMRGSLRRLISNDAEELSDLFKPSKENLARNMQSNRVPNSGRCVIVPDPTLKVDEVVIPRHLMYETCRDEFIEYIAEKKGVPLKKAESIYKVDAMEDDIEKLFDEYIEGDGKETAKYVIINRAPSLYELSMAACKVKLTYDYVMKIPMALCKPFNADYDGDAMTYYSIPKKMNSEIVEPLSPRNIFYFKKNHKPLYTPTHEMMHGLILASKVQIPDSLDTFDSFEELNNYKKTHRDFKYQTLVMLEGEKTTLGREILSKLFDKDINAYLGGITNNINASNCTQLYEQLSDKEDRLDRIQKIQEFCLKLTTLSGSTAPRISELYVGIDHKYIDKIRDIENNESLDQKTKDVTIRNIYEEFQKDLVSRLPEDIKTMVTEASRAKLEQLRDMTIQQLNIGPEGKFNLSDTTLVSCMAPLDYKNHAIENRAVQDIKQLSVPMSGYVTRQFNYLASEYIFSEGLDEENRGIDITEKEAEGRTKTDGEIIERSKSDKITKARSIVTSTLPVGVITKDMLTNKFNYKEGSKVGMSMISSLTESLTQSGLALKHSGNLFQFDRDGGFIKAPEDGRMIVEDGWVIFRSELKEYKWPEGAKFGGSFSPDGRFKKGEVIGRHYHLVTPSYRLDQVIKLTSANPVSGDKSFQNNKKILADCYARNSGKIRYIKDDNNSFKVKIGDEEYVYNDECMYYYPDGSEVTKYSRICTGTLDMKLLVKKEKEYTEIYKYFKKQFDELMEGTAPELIEFLFALLVKKGEKDEIEVQSVVRNVKNSKSFFKSLAFGYAGRSFKEIGYEGKEFIPDPITQVILPLIISNKL